MKKKFMLANKTLIMGILNITPDSFSDGGLYLSLDKAVKRVEQMTEGGADIIDVGGESTRPGAKSISIDEELRRVIPVIKKIRERFSNIPISIDTYKSKVAEKALGSGANIVNSLGGFLFDKKLADIITRFKCKIIIYHIKGEPRSMQKGEIKYKDVISDIKNFFEKQIAFGISKGIKKERFIIDPGIGFGKNVSQNLEIIKRLNEFKALNLPVAIGVSRKSHLGKILQDELKLHTLPSPTQRLEASLAETAIAVLNGASIVRTHDALETKKFLTIIDRLK